MQEKCWDRRELEHFFNERQVAALASWVQPSSYDRRLPPPPDFESPAWGKGPGADTCLATRRDGRLGSTALKYWRLCSGICQKLTMCKTRKLNYLETYTQASLSLTATQFTVSSAQSIHVNCRWAWIKYHPMSLMRAPCVRWTKLNNNLWIQSTVLKEIVWTGCLSSANLFTRDCSVQSSGLDA